GREAHPEERYIAVIEVSPVARPDVRAGNTQIHAPQRGPHQPPRGFTDLSGRIHCEVDESRQWYGRNSRCIIADDAAAEGDATSFGLYSSNAAAESHVCFA